MINTSYLAPSSALELLIADSKRIVPLINKRLEGGGLTAEVIEVGKCCLKQGRDSFANSYSPIILGIIEEIKKAGGKSLVAIEWRQKVDFEDPFSGDYVTAFAEIRK